MAGPLNVEQITRDLLISNEQLKKVQELLEIELNSGLARETNDRADIKMYPTYVRDVPNGTEKVGRLSHVSVARPLMAR